MEQTETQTLYDRIDEYFLLKEAGNSFSPKTIHNRRYELLRFADFCREQKIESPEEILKNTVISYLQKQKIQKHSKLSLLYVLTGFFDYLVSEKVLEENFVDAVEKPKVYQPRADYLSFEELQHLFRNEARNSTPKTLDRNLLLLRLFTDICLRVSEVVQLKKKDVRLDQKEIWIIRKRNKIDKIPINDGIVSGFENWYIMRDQYKGKELEWVFLSSHGKQLKPRQVHNIVSKALLRAGIVKRKHGPHLLRHSGASLKAMSGENLIMIQYLLGHENLNTTRRYLHFNWEDLRKMVERSPDLNENSGENNL